MKKYWLFFVLAIIAYLIRFHYLGVGIYGDGNGYYAISHTLYFEKKLNFDPIIKNMAGRIFWNTNKTITGVRNMPWLIGTSLFWLPSLAFISLINMFFKLNLSQFNVFYELGPGFTGIILGLAGLFFLEKYLGNFFKKKTVTLTIIGLLFGTNLLYYLFFEPALSHQISFFIICFLLYKSYRWEFSKTNLFLMGLLSGLLFITRLSEIIFLAPIYYQIIKNNRKKNNWSVWFFLIFGSFLGLLPQVIFQKMIYGSFLSNPYTNGQKGGLYNFSFVSIYNHLFSPARGLFLWFPLLLLGLIGSFCLIKNKKLFRLTVINLAVFVVYVFFIALWDPYVSAGFGDRFFIIAIPSLSLGLSYLVDKISGKKAILAVIFFCLWNCLLLNQFFFDGRRLVDDKKLSLRSLIIGQFTTPLKVIRLIREKGYNNTIYKYYIE